MSGARRDVLVLVARGLAAAALSVTGALGLVAARVPRRVKRLLGLRASDVRGVVLTDELILSRGTGDVITARARRCPHLGCRVEPAATGFECPCHGSVFDAEGRRISGPARAGLSIVELDVEPSGELSIRGEDEHGPRAGADGDRGARSGGARDG